MMWLTSLGADCGEGWFDPWSIFILDSRNMWQSLVRWSVLLP
jgi:hypothetical protein